MKNVLLWVSELFVMASFEVLNMAAVMSSKMASCDVRYSDALFIRVYDWLQWMEGDCLSSIIVSAIFFDIQ